MTAVFGQGICSRCSKITGVFSLKENDERYALCNMCLQWSSTAGGFAIKSALLQKTIEPPLNKTKGSVFVELSTSGLVVSLPNTRITLPSWKNAHLKGFLQGLVDVVDYKNYGNNHYSEFLLTRKDGNSEFFSGEVSTYNEPYFTQRTTLSEQDTKDLTECLLEFI
jgi:hypothetical protein